MVTEEVVPGVVRLSLLPFDSLNVYVLDGVLVDAGLPATRRALLRRLKGHVLTAHTLTHAHPDHQGGSRAVCEQHSIPLWCGEADRIAAETGRFKSVSPRQGVLASRLGDFVGGPGQVVERVLREGDPVADFVVIEAPGHTPGHLALWRARDRVVVLGDIAFHRDPITLRYRLREPYRSATCDPGLNRASARKLAALEPEVICFGHGPPLRDGERFCAWTRTLGS